MKINSDLFRTFLTCSIAIITIMVSSSCTSCSSTTNTSGTSPDNHLNVDAGTAVDAGTDALTPVLDAGNQIVEPETVSGETWSLQLPSNYFKTESTEPEIVLAAIVEQPIQAVLALALEPAKSKDEYLIYSLRGVRASGATLLSTSKVNLNGESFDLLEVSKSNVTVWIWLTVKNNLGYALSCGGPSSYDLLKPSCQEVVSTFKLK